jgi:simple sugar transport system ATP-binding protein
MRLKPEYEAPPDKALEVAIMGMTKRFGSFTALDNVSMKVEAGSFHALLGENGAGKSTLVKCLVGFYQPDEGQIAVNGRERTVRSPHDAHALGIGMVYQHFTLVPSMTVAENLVMSRSDVPAIVRWRDERERLAAFMDTVPFKVALDKPVSRLAAGEKQKVEILKQLYLQRRFMILDEPTSCPASGRRSARNAQADDARKQGHGVDDPQCFAGDGVRRRSIILRRGLLAGQGALPNWIRARWRK